jgi:DNA-binding transcriptional MerR regulator
VSQRDSDHWSIGEILSIIQEEFPDVTISKIRFLESKGLVSPERTPSGYRRFFQEDLDRLEWILRQQRDHYLPLKVIRSRLESGDLEGVNEIDSSPSLPFGGLDVEPPRPAPRTGRPYAKSGVADVDTGSAAGAEQDQAQDSGPGEPVVTESADAEPVAVDPETALAKDDEPEASVVEAVLVEAALVETAFTKEQSSAVPEARATEDTKITDRRGIASPGIGSNAAMTKDELSEASGCSPETLNELERFGLLSGRMIGPTVLYDGEALLLARLAAKFVEHGLEPRHLRTLKISAEHEVSLLTQVVEPMMHRRDPAAREQSLVTLADLVETSSALRAILIRQLVRELLPSQRG